MNSVITFSSYLVLLSLFVLVIDVRAYFMQIDEHIKLVNGLSREQGASQKVTIVKLQKDHDRMKTLVINNKKDL